MSGKHNQGAQQGADLATLVEEKLHSEPERSDPEGRWQKELQWLDDVLDHGHTIDDADMPRYIAATGESETSSEV